MAMSTAARDDRQTYLLLLLVFVLVGFGTVMVYSASAALGQLRFESGHFFLKRWLIRMSVSLLAMYLVMRVDYRVWARFARVFLTLGFLGLLAVLVFKLMGVGKVRGAYRWIPLPGGAFQPADLMRLALVLYLAESLSRRQGLIREFRQGFLPHAMIVGTAMFLILLQPDLSTALAIGLTCTLMLYLGGVRLSHLIGTGLALLPVLYVVVFVIGYRKERILTFFNPADDAQGAGYHVAQSLLALGSGGVTGVGLGQSLQKYFFLPEPHTDFVFSIVGEELGLLGTAGLVISFLIFARLGFRIARKAPDLHGFLLASGITFMVLVYAFVNMGVCTGVLPATGLPLPFISYGGSSLLLTLIATGMLINVGRRGAVDPGTLPRQSEERLIRMYRPANRRA
ncbi:MAG: putative lipid II flippase FtsW [bacterium]|nr:putative lipid II flippase FtsW [bacterium]